MPAESGGLVCDRSEAGGATAAVVAWPFTSREPAATPTASPLTVGCSVALEGAAPESIVFAQAAYLRKWLFLAGPLDTLLDRAQNRRGGPPVVIVTGISRPPVQDSSVINVGVAPSMHPDR
ncbi:hypothetical protein [Sorangium sp. So ce1078]|uniref:hypothetical protein n=1 Tax=Sorangium sp. So ce1078 TaxID=3133329 RepID=UPI003F5E9998